MVLTLDVITWLPAFAGMTKGEFDMWVWKHPGDGLNTGVFWHKKYALAALKAARNFPIGDGAVIGLDLPAPGVNIMVDDVSAKGFAQHC